MVSALDQWLREETGEQRTVVTESRGAAVALRPALRRFYLDTIKVSKSEVVVLRVGIKREGAEEVVRTYRANRPR